MQKSQQQNVLRGSSGSSIRAYGEQMLFLQVLDASKCLRSGTRKDIQADLIAAGARLAVHPDAVYEVLWRAILRVYQRYRHLVE